MFRYGQFSLYLSSMLVFFGTTIEHFGAKVFFSKCLEVFFFSSGCPTLWYFCQISIIWYFLVVLLAINGRKELFGNASGNFWFVLVVEAIFVISSSLVFGV